MPSGVSWVAEVQRALPHIGIIHKYLEFVADDEYYTACPKALAETAN